MFHNKRRFFSLAAAAGIINSKIIIPFGNSI
jgi:hypothetical protein